MSIAFNITGGLQIALGQMERPRQTNLPPQRTVQVKKKHTNFLFCRKFHELFWWTIFPMEISTIVTATGCNIPCSFKQYKLVSGESRNFDLKALPKDYLAVGFLAVSERTQVEEEILLYPFTSLLAEFGGALGLFLGVSFMTIWDGVKSLTTWVNWLK